MEFSSTRISDLPEITVNLPSFMEPVKTRNENNTTSPPPYQPMMNVHPNPYGIPKPDAPPDFNHPLPPRDYPRETIGYTQDDQTKVDYIPQPKLTHDFISHFDSSKENWENHRKQKHRLSKLDQLINEFQTPFFIALLFLMFQMPTVNSLFFKYFSFLSIYGADGNPNMYGLVFKSWLFGLSYYFALKTIDYFSEI